MPPRIGEPGCRPDPCPRPRLALISCGVDNNYGHPAPSTVRLLRSVGSTVLRTDQQGDLAVLDEAGRVSVATRPR
ncbi:hypothetical protein [Streptacidiphilus sp. PAMC 29251]